MFQLLQPGEFIIINDQKYSFYNDNGSVCWIILEYISHIMFETDSKMSTFLRFGLRTQETTTERNISHYLDLKSTGSLLLYWSVKPWVRDEIFIFYVLCQWTFNSSCPNPLLLPQTMIDSILPRKNKSSGLESSLRGSIKCEDIKSGLARVKAVACGLFST